jgi:dipeptidyl-peptidase 4
MTDTFPRQYARTLRFTLGVPRSFQISPDGGTVAFLRSRSGSDPVTCLWVHDVATGTERLVADPVQLDEPGFDLDPAEKARRERAREAARGIVGFTADGEFRTAAFGLSGRVYLADLESGSAAPDSAAGVRELDVRRPAADPRLSPSGTLLGYACGGTLRVLDLDSGEDRAVAEGAGQVTFGLAEFVAAEEMNRTRGYWWAPDSSALLAARVDDSPLERWYIADPANPGQPPNEVRYPAAGTANAEVDLFLVALGGPADDAMLTQIRWDAAAFPYLVTACWEGAAAAAQPPLIVVQSRDQRRMQILAVDTASGATSVVRDDFGEPWLDIVDGVPARTGDGLIVWTANSEDTRRLLVATAQDLAAGTAEPVTPAGLHIRQVHSVDDSTVLFSASDGEPTQIGLWTYGPHGLARAAASDEPQVQSGLLGGGTTVAVSRSLRQDGASFRVLREGRETARIGSHPERPTLPAPAPDLFRAGELGICTALLLPSWHRPGSAALPVLMDPYGGPHGQMVQASRSMFLPSQWIAEQGFAVVVADGRGTPGHGLSWEHAVAGDLAGPTLADQVTALQAAADRCADLDLGRVAIRGWSFGGFLSALAVLRRPDVFHAAIAGAPVTEQRLYDTHYTERYLGHPDENPEAYERSSLLADAHKLARPLLIIHGLADDNVVVAHTLRLSSALLAAGRQHSVLPLSGVTHMASQEEVAENLLLLQVDFLRSALKLEAPRGD